MISPDAGGGLTGGAHAAVGLLFGAVALPAAVTAGLALALWCRVRPSEKVSSTVVSASFGLVAAAAAALGALLLATGRPMVAVECRAWFGPTPGWHWRLVADRLSIPFSAFAAGLIGMIGALSRRYLHREGGFWRFYVLLALFGTGVELVVLGGSLPVMSVGWELVGLSSALLISFFHDRPGPVRNGLRAFLTYRTCDIGLVLAAGWLAAAGSVDLVSPTGGAPSPLIGAARWAGSSGWATLPVPASSTRATLVAAALILAVVGKSALLPASGWLPRAMEGPTPSSAVFYGALSVHLGPYLLLRSHALLEAAPAARVVVVGLGLATALHATLVGRAQSDIKSSLAYASMTQVGLIVAEIGAGLYVPAVVHILGHATVRAAQILRSPSLLHDRHHLEQALGGPSLTHQGRHPARLIPRRWRPRLYRYAFAHGHLDARLRRLAIPLSRALRTVDGWQRRAADRIGGAQPARPVPPGPVTVGEL